MDNKIQQKETQVKNSNDYYLGKAKYAYNLFINNLPFKKVYGIVEKGGSYIAFQFANGEINPFSGGGVDEGEDNITAIKREILEEMNINVKIIKSLGVCEHFRTWKYEGKCFDVKYLVEIFETKFVSYGKNTKFGLTGEISTDTKIIEISKQTMLENVKFYTEMGIKFN